MLQWALVFWILAIATAVQGFSGGVSVISDACRVFFVVFTVLFFVSLIAGLVRRP